MNKELSPKDVLAISCPTCGAKPKERCELSTNQPRTSPHRDRRLVAKDKSLQHGRNHQVRSNLFTKLKTVASVADILEREIEPTIKEWLRRVNLVSELRDIPLSDADRTGHLPKLFYDLTCRLRLTEVCDSASAAAHGRKRREQGYTPSMLVEESRVFEVATFSTLRLHQRELDQDQLLPAVILIADEVDGQLMETVRSLVEAKPA
jgi:hypothetical protein